MSAKERGEIMLDERKLAVLYAIINAYITTGEPIGSRTISKNYGLGVSSATIRNEMSDLEELGYLAKTHTSSGRIPSTKAYRFYVNDFMAEHFHRLKVENERTLGLIEHRIEANDRLLKRATEILAGLTQYTTVGMMKEREDAKIVRISLIGLSEKTVLVVLALEDKEALHFPIELTDPVSEAELHDLSIRLSTIAHGLRPAEAAKKLESAWMGELRESSKLLKAMVPKLREESLANERIELTLGGVSHIFNYPEYNEPNKAQNFLQFLEDREKLLELLDETSDELMIKIGGENEHEALRDSSVLLSTLHEGGDVVGKIGIIGPMRMDYKRVIQAIWHLNQELESFFDTTKEE